MICTNSTYDNNNNDSIHRVCYCRPEDQDISQLIVTHKMTLTNTHILMIRIMAPGSEDITGGGHRHLRHDNTNNSSTKHIDDK